MWRSVTGDNQEVLATLDAAVATLRAKGATVVDNLELEEWTRSASPSSRPC
ncbi:hypothetical protein ACFQX6_21745 [Streptosporangium lutulentum]